MLWIFSWGGVPSSAIFYDFHTSAPWQFNTQRDQILQEYYFLWSLEAHQLSLKSEDELWTVILQVMSHMNIKWFIIKQTYTKLSLLLTVKTDKLMDEVQMSYVLQLQWCKANNGNMLYSHNFDPIN